MVLIQSRYLIDTRILTEGFVKRVELELWITQLAREVPSLVLEVLELPFLQVACIAERLDVDGVAQLPTLELDNDRMSLRFDGQKVETVPGIRDEHLPPNHEKGLPENRWVPQRSSLRGALPATSLL